MVKQQSVNEQVNGKAIPNMTPAQQVLQDLFQAHLLSEFVAHKSFSSIPFLEISHLRVCILSNGKILKNG
jgi:hypothetical protein